jgi:hypothetical protein
MATIGAPHSSIEDGVGIVDLAATDAGKVATKQRLQHQHERIAFTPQELLPENVGADTDFLEKRDSHSFCLPVFFLSSCFAASGCLMNVSARR